MISNVLVFTGPFKVDVGQINLPEPGPGQVVARTIVTGVSTGTETRVFSGKQTGCLFPLVPGYETVGEVIRQGAGVDLPIGTRVFYAGSSFTGAYARCWGGQVQVGVVETARVVQIPASVDPAAAVYAKTTAIALHGVERGRIRAGEFVAVVGQGLIGFLAAQVAKARGARVIVVDTLPERLETARRAGIEFVINAAGQDVQAAVQEITGGGVDVAIDATGVARIVDQTIRLIREKPWREPQPPSGRLVILGSYTDPVSFDYDASLFTREPDIFPSRDHTYSDLDQAMQLIASGDIHTEAIAAQRLPFTQAAAGYQSLLDRSAMRVIFEWE
jgi:bacteriochlorophyllide a dehydrogenase